MKPLSILHVEDDDAASLLVQVALQEVFPEVKYQRVSDVDKAFQLLWAIAEEPCGLLPKIILLDLNLPKKSGFEMLKAVRESPHFAQMCVVVLTSSTAASDRKMAMERGATKYVVKPSTFEGYLTVLRDVIQLAQDGDFR